MKSIESIVLASVNVIATKDLSRVLMATGYPEATSNKIAGVKMKLTKASKIEKGISPLTIAQRTKGLDKKSVAEFRKNVIATVDVLNSAQIGILFDISTSSASSYSAHVTRKKKVKKVVAVDAFKKENNCGAQRSHRPGK